MVPTRTVYVGNIPFSSTEESLRTAFADYEPVAVKVLEGKGVAFIDVPARRAFGMIRDTDGSRLEGRLLSVSIARPRENEPTLRQDDFRQREVRDDRPRAPREPYGRQDRAERPPRRQPEDGDPPPWKRARPESNDDRPRPPRPEGRGGPPPWKGQERPGQMPFRGNRPEKPWGGRDERPAKGDRPKRRFGPPGDTTGPSGPAPKPKRTFTPKKYRPDAGPGGGAEARKRKGNRPFKPRRPD